VFEAAVERAIAVARPSPSSGMVTRVLNREAAMGKGAKILLSILIVFGGIIVWGFIAANVIGPERLATSGVPGTATLLIAVVICGIALKFLWRQPKGANRG